MLSLHLNGELIRHPDSAGNYIRRMAQYDQSGRCKYGIKEIYCRAYTDHLKQQPCFGEPHADGSRRVPVRVRCTLCGCDKLTARRTYDNELKTDIITYHYLCPGRDKLKQRGNIKKSYSITNKHYRKLSSAGAYLIKTTEHKAIFFTLTFPPYKKTVTDEQHNKYFSRFFENLRKNYGVRAYIAVREYGEERGRNHYHCIVDLPYISFISLNDIWCNTISDICDYSKNALTTSRRGSVIYNYRHAIGYICKYFSKAKYKKSPARLVFMGGIQLTKAVETVDATTGEIKTRRVPAFVTGLAGDYTKYLAGYKGIYIKHDEFITIWRITDNNEFLRFCQNIVFPQFGLNINKPPNLHVAD